MKRILAPYLICPACLPKEFSLQLTADRESDGDIIAGMLTCTKCSRRFPIKEGVAQLLPDPDSGPSGGQWRYEEQGMTARYLWSHYSDITNHADTAPATGLWTDCLAKQVPAAFDAGCSVGRMTFEMAARSELAVGCDLSHSFIKTARLLARERRLTFSLPLEGNLTENFELCLPETWRTDNVEFVVADVLRLPFARDLFQQVASLNLLDRVSYPLAHLYEMNRVAASQHASFLFADPFSWSTTAAPEERWLGGTTTGPYQGRGIDNVRLLLEGSGKVLTPPWSITSAGSTAWKMRTHRNHYEVITSEYLVARR